MANPRLLALCLLATVLSLTGIGAAEQDVPDNTGLPIGQRAPDFILKDQHDESVSLDTLVEKGPVAVVFSRSAAWCLFCKMQLVQLQRNLRQIEACGGQVVSISTDPVEKLKRLSDTQGITFHLLSDPGAKTVDSYNFRNKTAPEEWGGVARHGTFILDRNRIIRAKLFELSYNEGPAIEALVEALTQARSTKEGRRP